MNKIFLIISLLVVLLFTGCSSKNKYSYANRGSSKVINYPDSKSNYNTQMTKREYKYAKMNPYVVRGIRYYPRNVNVGDQFTGYASWYGPDFHGKLTANGETYNMHDMTAAHKTLPMNTMLRVTNKRNGLSAVVRINDRGPYIGTRIIDLSNNAAHKINMVGAGTAPVTIEVLGFYSKNKQKSRKKVIAKKPYKAKPVKKVTPAQKKADDIVGAYSLQIASFSNIEGAIKIQEQHDKTDGYNTVIKDIATAQGRLFKVYLRGFQSEKEIRDYKANGNFTNSFIVKEELK